jgi:hypothetical protein
MRSTRMLHLNLKKKNLNIFQGILMTMHVYFYLHLYFDDFIDNIVFILPMYHKYFITFKVEILKVSKTGNNWKFGLFILNIMYNAARMIVHVM